MNNVGLKRGVLELHEYNNNYTYIYNEEKKRLEKILNGMYIKIEHVGSTAIKNIKSKPIIDILVVCRDLEEFKKFAKEKVQNDTYTIKEEMVNNEDFLIRKEEDGKVKAFIHVVPYNSHRMEDYILFRDYMNNHENEAKEYEKLKMDLANEFKDNRRQYTLSKDEYINRIIEKAKKEYSE